MLSPRELRHDLHKHPELSLQEERTTRVIKENIELMLDKYGHSYKIQRPLKTGILLDYCPLDSKEYILLRADIDALPIQEKTGAKFQSINENMHACGHDIHTAILYATLRYVLKNQIQKNLIFLFQPAEEESGGAKKIIDSKILDEYDIKAAYALHINDEYSAGTIACRPNILFASSLELDVEFEGKASHIANADQGRNALTALSHFLHQTEKLIEKSSEKVLLGFGEAHSGTARNIIPETANLKGTLRTLSMDRANDYFKRIKDVLEQIKSKRGVDYTLQKGAQYKEVYNSPYLFNKAKYALIRDFSFIHCDMKMTAEDFGYFSALYPSLMIWLGSRTGDNVAGLHTPYFLPDDDIIETGLEINKRLLGIL
ncbi:MAG: amidohydrolase [Candidatus Marinimicrobia bacterium]|nr:amidohydrolase [Candidatus Neomarinimicrobiota bacterium]